MKKAFTLAEVLITLAIVGVVAAMTIPTLIAKINEKVTQNQKKVFEAKVLKGLNLTRTHGDLNNTYSSTYDFLQNGLGKHLKMAKICDASHTRDCVPYDNITYTYNDADELVAVKDIDSAEELGKKEEDGYKDIASFVMGDGTVVIATYKKDCLVDEGKLDKDLGENECFAGIYDLNGTRKPNKMGKDLLTFNGATLNIDHGPVVLATLGGVKLISNPEVPTGTPISTYCDNDNKTVKPEYAKYGITQCCTHPTCQSQGDRWVTAMKTCQDAGGRLPTKTELTKIAQELYNNPDIGDDYKKVNLDTSKIPSALSGLGSSWYYLWSSSAYNNMANHRLFNTSGTAMYGDNRGYSSVSAICVVD